MTFTYTRYYQHPQRPPKRSRKEAVPRYKRDRAINPDTGKPFRDPRSRLAGGRVICKGVDMTYLRERVGIREAEICQGHDCDAWAPMYPQDGQPAGEMHHIFGRGGGRRDDRAENMQWLCRNCHRVAKIRPRVAVSEESRERSA